jgi:WD40 repeat protein/transcriptional regulator with XRE-family HTH domain
LLLPGVFLTLSRTSNCLKDSVKSRGEKPQQEVILWTNHRHLPVKVVQIGGKQSEVPVEQHIPFHQQLKYEREHHGWSQAELAERLKIDAKTVYRWESGASTPQHLHRRRLCKLFGKNAEEFGLLDEEQGPENAVLPYPREDWGEAPRVGNFYGRDQQSAQLEQWIVHDQCSMVAVLGMGGIGKTTLAVHLARQVKGEFDYVFWRSLYNAPPLSSFLKQCIQFVSDQQRADLPGRIDEQIHILISYLQQRRCLLILDNVESILRPGSRPGHYLDGYDNYGELLRRLGEATHRSCLLLTSREMLWEVAHLEGRAAPVRSLSLPGMEQSAGQEMLQGQSLSGSTEQRSRLVDFYSGNPLALKLVSQSIYALFGGDIDEFLQAKETVFGDINELLERQFLRLSPQERELLYWLAIEREPVSLPAIQADLVHAGLKHRVVDTLDSLRRRFLIEARDSASFTLQPVILEYVTNDLVKRASDEFIAGDTSSPVIWQSYALIKALAKEYVRASQVRMLLAPIAHNLQAAVGEEGIERRLKDWLEVRRHASPHQGSYVAGNALNLLHYLQRDLRNADFSRVMIRQADLQDVQLPNVNFSHAHFESTAFTNIFGNVLTISCSRSNNLMAVGTATGEIWIYEMLTGVPIHLLSGHTDGVWSTAFSPDEHVLASSGDDCTIRLWNLTAGEGLGVLAEHTHRVRCVAFSPDGSLLASGCDDTIVRLWDIQQNQYTRMLQGHTDRVWSVAFSPDGRILASGSNDHTIRLWDTATDTHLDTLRGHTGWIWSVAFNAQGTLLASGSEDHTARLWDVKSLQCNAILQDHTSGVRSVAFNTEGTLLASGSEDQTVRLWNIATSHGLQVLQGHLQGVRAVAFQHEGDLLASGGDDQTIRLWDITMGYSLKTLQGYTRRIWSIAFSPDSQSLVSGGEDHRIRLWDVTTGRSDKVLPDRTHGARSIVFSPDGRSLASGGEDQTVRLWSIKTGRSIQSLTGHKKWVRSVAFSADGRWLASGGEECEVWLWNVNTGRGRIIPQGHNSWVRTVAFSPDGNVLASGSDDGTIRLWDLNTNRSLQALSSHNGRVRCIDFSSDGNVLASGSEDQAIHLWNISTGSILLTLVGHTSWVRSVVFSPIDRLLASSSDDHTIRLWNIDDGNCLAILRGHTDRIRSLAFSLNGQLLASGSDDGEIKLWDAQKAVYLKHLINEKPYEGMNIAGVSGLTEAQKDALRSLGAIDA